MKLGSKDPTSTSELGRRLERVADLYPSRKVAAEVAGKSVDMLAAYLKGRIDPPLGAVQRLCADKGISVDWLLTGEGPMMVADRQLAEPPALPAPAPASTPVAAAIDEDLMARVAEGIADIYKTENAAIYPLVLVRTATRLYADLVAVCETPEERLAGLKMALHQLRRELRQPVGEAGSRKEVS